MKWTKEKTAELVRIMKENYPNAECALDFGNLFQLLIAVTLSAQTTDKQVNVVTKDLFAKYPDPQTMSQATVEELSEIIRRIGMYRTKAKNISAISRILMEEYGGQVPQVHEELVKLPGVGRKTANVVLAVGCGVPAIAVDTHVFRVANRIGIVEAKDVLKTELGLMEQIPREDWIDMHHALIWHGRRVCSARGPKCEICQVSGLCRYYEEEIKGKNEAAHPLDTRAKKKIEAAGTEGKKRKRAGLAAEGSEE